MDFKDKYTSLTKKEAEKTQISDEAYAIGELLDELKNKLESLRISLQR